MSMNNEMKIDIHTVKDTERLAAQLASLAFPGMVIALNGDLGAGKTTFSKAFASGLGVKEVVSSPTFTIIKEYAGEQLPFYHMDVYRISLEEADELGLDDYFFGQGVTIVEWANIIEEILPSTYLELYLEYINEHERTVHVKAFGKPYEECLTKMIDGSFHA